ncbi:MAG: AAA family ATPase [Pseudoxanthomonas sp.]
MTYLQNLHGDSKGVTMSPVAGYVIISKILEGSSAVIYRATQAITGSPVVIKVPRDEYPTPRDLATLRHEYLLLSSLNVAGVVKTYGLEKCGHGLALLLEDLRGQSLMSLQRAQKIDIKTLLRIIIKVTEIMQEIHAKGIIHRDIKPHNIMVDVGRDTLQVHLIDFGAATRLSQEAQKSDASALVESSLAYISPEQTGRMNRVIDHRTDLYSLGVTLYELLTGALPFTTVDPVELVHSHIARQPVPPHELIPAIPAALSAVVMKLLAKTAEDRYQSAHGIRIDLVRCLGELEKTGTIAPFVPGQHDHSVELRLSQKVYGRSAELETLLAALDRVRKGAAELVVLRGASGVGKSTLIDELSRVLVQQGGLTTLGRCELMTSGQPYSSLAQAFRDLCQQLLIGSPQALARWKEELRAAVGNNGRLLTELIPELELLIGPQPMPLQLGLAESQNRFNLVFQTFLKTFATAAHPLVLCLDDLQWVDPATLSLLQLVATDPGRGHLLVVGSYRDGEAAASQPLVQTLGALRQAGVALHELTLGALTVADIESFLADSLRSTRERVVPLAKALYDKTHGNPFFVKQTLLALRRDELLYFDFASESWLWKLPEILNYRVADNVVDFTVGKIQLLPAPAQEVLKLAACIGSQFELETLAALCQKTVPETAGILWDALREGLCAPLDADYRLVDPESQIALGGLGFKVAYRFLHDRVQQAAYSLLPESELPALHLQVARLLRLRSQGQVADTELFALANHYQRGAALIDDTQERHDVAELCLRAGQRAKLTTAYQAAADYFHTGVAILGPEPFSQSYALAAQLHIEQAECRYLSGQLTQAESLFELVIPQLRSDLEHARVATLRTELYATKGLMEKALATGLDGLARLGFTFPGTQGEHFAALPQATAEFKTLLGGRSIAELLALPSPTREDPMQAWIQRLLLGTCTASFFVRPTLIALLALKQAALSVQHGHTDVAAYGYMSYAVIAANVLGATAEAYEFGKLGIELNQKFGNLPLTCKLNSMFAGFISHYHRPLREGLAYLRGGLNTGLETGDFTWVGFGCFHLDTQLLGSGEELAAVQQELEKLLGIAQRAREVFAQSALAVAQQTVANLTGQTTSRNTLSSATFDEDKFTALFTQAEFTTLECWYYSAKLQLAYLYGDYERAYQLALLAHARAGGAMGLHFVTDLYFYTCLALTALSHLPAETPSAPAAAGAEESPGALLARLQAQLAVWAAACPENYQHKHVLVAAEVARLRGEPIEAVELYDQSITLAQQSEFIHHAALASELCARALLARGRTRFASVYVRDAYYGYERWGATAKLTQLLEQFPAMAQEMREKSSRDSNPTTTTSSRLAAGGMLDLMAVLHAAQSMASEIVLDRLLEQVLRLVVANAGAQRGFLILEREGALIVEAAITVSPDHVQVGMALPLAACPNLARSVVQLVAHTREAVVLGNASTDSRYGNDPYIIAAQPKSVLCLALRYRGRLTGILYLENNLTEHAFTEERIEVLRLLSGQAAIAVENALLYSRLREIGDKLQFSNGELRQANTELLQRSEELRQANERTQDSLTERVRVEQERNRLQQEVIRIQSDRLAEIAAPLIPITDEIMVMPLIGTMDTERAKQVTETVLEGSQRHRIRVVIIDITGMKHVDTNVASLLINSATALRLLGTQAVLTGIRAEVAQTLVSLGIDLGGLVTRGTLQSGIAYAATQLGSSLFAKRPPNR